MTPTNFSRFFIPQVDDKGQPLSEGNITFHMYVRILSSTTTNTTRPTLLNIDLCGRTRPLTTCWCRTSVGQVQSQGRKSVKGVILIYFYNGKLQCLLLLRYLVAWVHPNPVYNKKIKVYKHTIRLMLLITRKTHTKSLPEESEELKKSEKKVIEGHYRWLKVTVRLHPENHHSLFRITFRPLFLLLCESEIFVVLQICYAILYKFAFLPDFISHIYPRKTAKTPPFFPLSLFLLNLLILEVSLTICRYLSGFFFIEIGRVIERTDGQ